MMNYDFLNTKNKIEGLTLIVKEYQFLTQEVLNNKEYFKFRLTQEAQQRELELFKLSGIEKCISDFKENDLEKCFLWTDEEGKKEYLSSVRYNIEQSLKASISYAVKTNVEIDEFSDSFLLLKNDYNILKQINELVKKELVKLKYDYMSFYRENLKLYDSYDVELTENQKEFKRNLINELKEVEKPKNKTRDKRTTQKYKVGFLIAKGELNKYWNENKNGKCENVTYNDILNGLGISFDVVIKATMSDYKVPNPNANKNIFNDIEVMSFIIEDCKNQKIEIDEHFLSRYNDLKAKTI